MPQLQIERLAYGGSGFGRIDGKACFVPFTAPGDLVSIKIEKSRNSYSEGVVESILTPSKDRISSQCPVFGMCGGCNWQHISYVEQCNQKESILADTLWRTARIERDKIRPIIAAASPFGYRQRIQLKTDFSSGKLSLGFHRRSSHDVIDINDFCAIATQPLNSAIAQVREIVASFSKPSQIPQVDLASSANASVSALFHYSGEQHESLAEHLSRQHLGISVIHSISMLAGSRRTYRHICGLHKLAYSVPTSSGSDMELFYGPDSFSQINFLQNRVMVQLLLNFCLEISPEAVLDLFCGNGNFSLPLAGLAKNILGFESVKKSISFAEHNSSFNKIMNARYCCNDSLSGVEALAGQARKFDLVIMDPPRSGAAEVARIVHKIAVSDLIYISCDPPTLARDISLLQQSGFTVVYIQPVDMFPQTYHLESIVFLKSA